MLYEMFLFATNYNQSESLILSDNFEVLGIYNCRK